MSSSVSTPQPHFAPSGSVVVQHWMWVRADSLRVIEQLHEHAPCTGEVPDLLWCVCWSPKEPELHPYSLVTVWTDLDSYMSWRSSAARDHARRRIVPPVADMLVNSAEVEIGMLVHRESAAASKMVGLTCDDEGPDRSPAAFIRRRFRRRWNRRLLSATALLTVVMGWLLAQSALSYRSLVIGEQQAYPRIHALWQGRSLAADADGNESLSLIARGNGAAFDNAFKTETALLVSGGLTPEAIGLATRGQFRFGGLLADEVRSASFPGERDAAVALLRAYRRFLLADASIRARIAVGDYDHAVALALGSSAGQLAAAFDDLQLAFDQVIAILQRHFDEAIAAASPGQPLIVGLPLLGMSVAVLVLWGVQPRIAEYRA